MESSYSKISVALNTFALLALVFNDCRYSQINMAVITALGLNMFCIVMIYYKTQNLPKISILLMTSLVITLLSMVLMTATDMCYDDRIKYAVYLLLLANFVTYQQLFFGTHKIPQQAWAGLTGKIPYPSTDEGDDEVTGLGWVV